MFAGGQTAQQLVDEKAATLNRRATFKDLGFPSVGHPDDLQRDYNNSSKGPTYSLPLRIVGDARWFQVAPTSKPAKSVDFDKRVGVGVNIRTNGDSPVLYLFVEAKSTADADIELAVETGKILLQEWLDAVAQDAAEAIRTQSERRRERDRQIEKEYQRRQIGRTVYGTVSPAVADTATRAPSGVGRSVAARQKPVPERTSRLPRNLYWVIGLITLAVIAIWIRHHWRG